GSKSATSKCTAWRRARASPSSSSRASAATTPRGASSSRSLPSATACAPSTPAAPGKRIIQLCPTPPPASPTTPSGRRHPSGPRAGFGQDVVLIMLANPHPPTQVGFARQAGAVAGHDTLDRLDRIRCPTLVTVGTEDILVPLRLSRVLVDRIPRAELHGLEG